MLNKHIVALGLAAGLAMVGCSSGEGASEGAARGANYVLDDNGTVVPEEPVEADDEIDANQARSEGDGKEG
jgi:hypothetical protein